MRFLCLTVHHTSSCCLHLSPSLPNFVLADTNKCLFGRAPDPPKIAPTSASLLERGSSGEEDIL